MSKLAINGGTPVTTDLLGTTQLVSRRDLERKYLLQVFEEGPHNDWPNEKSMAASFASEFARFCTSRFCALLTNGTHALQVALESLDIGWGDEVIVPGLTWQATASVVCDINAVPIMVDVDPDTLCIDVSQIEEAITRRTRAIIPVHLYHRMADMDRIIRIARKHHLPVIEDCAHSHGSRWDDRGSGSLGTFGSFSFQSSKMMNAAEGGALITSDEDLFWRVVSLKSCGREVKQNAKVHSGNFRITGFQAAILRGQLAALRHNAPIFDHNGLALDAAIAAAPGVMALRRNPHISRQTGYHFCFLYRPEVFDEAPGELFRRALSAELNWPFGTTYTPLNHSEVYYPHTKPRHAISPTYLRAIDPSRWQLPAAEALWKTRAVTSFWSIYGMRASRAHVLTDAIAKIHEHRGELRAAH
jgi:L-glutamine:2-deoxy-scyllo-inosose/3-amino-2,3-dideoxy-scyllo-inosose aminotransferase